jgi:uncharacterized SAM-binding protein YcdF (DUF218 family)
MQGMAKALRALIGAGGVALALFIFGFVIFVRLTTREATSPVEPADAIVVLTGGQQRIGEAVRLLSEGTARRLLISGVNRRISKAEARRLTGLDHRRFDCCVDVGYGAQDTSGNADETRAWVATWGFSSLIVVTASYHMPRSLIEIGRTLPGVRLIPHPVVPKSLRTDLWLHLDAARILVSEYLKCLPSAARFAGARLVAQRDWSAFTSVAAHRNAKT